MCTNKKKKTPEKLGNCKIVTFLLKAGYKL